MTVFPGPVVVTGATNGIGAAAARALHADGVPLVLMGRNPDKLAAMARELPGVETETADFESFTAVRAAAARILERHPRLGALVNNAGGYWPKAHRTEDGHERTWQVDQLSPFLLTELLRPALDHDGARIINVASEMQARGRLALDGTGTGPDGVTGVAAYAQAKLANVTWTYALARRLRHAVAHAVHPGVVDTGIYATTPPLLRPFVWLFTRGALSPEQGADTVVWLLTAPEGGATTGGYWARRKPLASRPESLDEAVQERLWAHCAEATGAGG